MKHQKHHDADSGINHFGKVLDLAKKLAELNVAVYQHKWYCLVMGS